MSSILRTALAICCLALAVTYFITHQGKALLAKRAAEAAAAAPQTNPQPANIAPVVRATGPQATPAPSARSISLEPNELGHYHASAELNGRTIGLLVDTGASFVSLTAEDARNIGVYPSESDFKLRMSTANGEAKAAQVTLSAIRIGGISIYDVPAIVMQPGASTTSLLGMSFLKKLSGFEVAQGRLVLRQ